MYHILRQKPLPKKDKIRNYPKNHCKKSFKTNISISAFIYLHLKCYIYEDLINLLWQFRIRHTIQRMGKSEIEFHQLPLTFRKLLVIHTYFFREIYCIINIIILVCKYIQIFREIDSINMYFFKEITIED